MAECLNRNTRKRAVPTRWCPNKNLLLRTSVYVKLAREHIRLKFS